LGTEIQAASRALTTPLFECPMTAVPADHAIPAMLIMHAKIPPLASTTAADGDVVYARTFGPFTQPSLLHFPLGFHTLP
jgi:hypothetical protein